MDGLLMVALNTISEPMSTLRRPVRIELNLVIVSTLVNQVGLRRWEFS